MAEVFKTLALSLVLATNFTKETGFAQKELSKLISVFDFLKKSVADVSGTTNLLLKSSFIGVGVFTAAAITKIVEMNKNLAVSSTRYSVLRKDIAEYTKTLFKAADGSGIAIDQVDELNHKLLDQGYKFGSNFKQMSELSKTIFKFSTVTGVTVDKVTSFSAELSKMGVRSEDLLENIHKLNQAYPLTTENLGELMEITKSVTNNLVLFSDAASRSSTNIELLTENLQDAAAQLLAVGANAQDVTKLMENLTDPMSFIDNAKAMTIMGFSMNDVSKAMQGGPIEAAEKLRSRLLELQKAGGMTFSYMTRQMGLTRQTAAALVSDEYGKLLSKQKEQQANQESINKTWSAAMEASGNLQRSWSKFITTFLVAAKPLADVVTKVFVFLVSVLDKAATLLSKLKLGFSGMMILIVTAITLGAAAFKLSLIALGKIIGVVFKQVTTEVKGSIDVMKSSIDDAIIKVERLLMLIARANGATIKELNWARTGKMPGQKTPTQPQTPETPKTPEVNLMSMALKSAVVGGILAAFMEVFSGPVGASIQQKIMRAVVLGLTTALGAFLGSLLDFFLGPFGTILGGAAGGAIGNWINNKFLPYEEDTAKASEETARNTERIAAKGEKPVSPLFGANIFGMHNRVFSTSFEQYAAMAQRQEEYQKEANRKLSEMIYYTKHGATSSADIARFTGQQARHAKVYGSVPAV